MTFVLVAYGSKRGSTKEIAEWIGADLRKERLHVDVRAANTVRDVTPYHVVIIGGALYAGRWHRHARRFARRHARMLRDRPVWLFSSGPLDISAEERNVPPVPSVDRVAKLVDARGHVTFGGRLSADAQGFPAAALAKNKSGDFRSADQIHAWVADVVWQLRAVPR